MWSNFFQISDSDYIPWLNENSFEFPPISSALKEPNGLLAVGGDLSPNRLVQAYRQGIFPWYETGSPILWWSPKPRAVLYLENLKVSRSLRKTLKKNIFNITLNKAFNDVIQLCCKIPRPNQNGTWITSEMQQAYGKLHTMGYAHSVEAWFDNKLVGGLYGVSLGKLFFGESMFSLMPDASKVSLVFLVKHLIQYDFPLIDCQIPNPHLSSLGAMEISQEIFQQFLNENKQWPLLLEEQSSPWNLSRCLKFENHIKLK